MDPFNPIPGERLDYEQQKWQHGQKSSAGKHALWILGIVAGAFGILAVVSAL